jgi:hypothetical protein
MSGRFRLRATRRANRFQIEASRATNGQEGDAALPTKPVDCCGGLIKRVRERLLVQKGRRRSCLRVALLSDGFGGPFACGRAHELQQSCQGVLVV